MRLVPEPREPEPFPRARASREPLRWVRPLRRCLPARRRVPIGRAARGRRRPLRPLRRMRGRLPEGAREIVGRRAGAREVMAEVERDRPFYDESGGGVTFSGGEPLAQPGFLAEMLARASERDIHAAVDTSLHAPWDTVGRVAGEVGLWLCDVKHADAAAHERGTGASNELALANLRRLAEAGARIIVRMPLVPGFNDHDANVDATGEILRSLASVERLDLLPYNVGGREKAARLSASRDAPVFEAVERERVEAVATRLRGFGLDVGIGG